eukprot:UN03667
MEYLVYRQLPFEIHTPAIHQDFHLDWHNSLQLHQIHH